MSDETGVPHTSTETRYVNQTRATVKPGREYDAGAGRWRLNIWVNRCLGHPDMYAATTCALAQARDAATPECAALPVTLQHRIVKQIRITTITTEVLEVMPGSH